MLFLEKCEQCHYDVEDSKHDTAKVVPGDEMQVPPFPHNGHNLASPDERPERFNRPE